METSDVQSIDSIRSLRGAVLELGHDWDMAVQEIQFSTHRIKEHFTATLPAYWKSQTRAAEQSLAEAKNNLSRQAGVSSDGNSPATSEARQRVQLAKRRLALCEDKQRAALKIALQLEQACQELAGPIAEVLGHSSTTLPGAAGFLETLIGHLDQYAESAVAGRIDSARDQNADLKAADRDVAASATPSKDSETT